jgi:ribosomal protein S18 acetylase RimI-like enzyme
MSRPTFTVQALQLEDVPLAAQIASDAFLIDRQTQMKALGSEPFLMKEYTLQSLPDLLKHPRCIALKAIDDKSGEMAGYCTWGFRGIGPEEMPEVKGRIQPAQVAEADSSAPVEQQESQDATETEAKKSSNSTNSIQRLIAMQDEDMESWLEEVMPEGTRCMYIVGLSISPKHQGRGAGSALLQWGTAVCDQLQIFAWVHSSELAWKMYEKKGFRTVRQLDCDLDAYAPGPPPDESPGAKWGHYVLRYMRYDPGRT